MHGHTLGDYLVHADARAELLFLGAGAEAAMFAPLTARRWPSGVLLFDTHDFETGAEEAARQAFEEHRTLSGVSGVPSPVRAAFGYAVAMRLGRERGTRLAPAEIRADVGRLADGGDDVAATVLDRIEQERERQRLAPTIDLGRAPMLPSRLSDDERIEGAITAAGGQLLATQVRGDAVEVRFLLRGERFSSLVRPGSLQVLDAGICLSGEDRLITIESLPSVIIEGLDTGQLVMTRRT